MTLSLCDQLAERVALGEALGDLAEHAETCERCARLVAMTGQLAASHHAVDPGLGFSARMTVGAQHVIAMRRRRRVAAGLSVSVVTGAFAVFFVTRTPDEHAAPPIALPSVRHAPPPPDPEVEPATDDDLAALVQMADVRRSSRLSARWGHIKKPLRPYKQLIEGVTP